MGYLTTITIFNDALHSFHEDPLKFGQSILDGIYQANDNHKETSIPFNGYCNYISIQPSRHADDETLYLHSGNGVFNLNPYNEDFKNLISNRPELAADFIKRAERIIKDAKRKLKEAK